MSTHTIEITVERDEVEFELEVSGYVEPLVRGKYFGPPENCYPDEGGYAEIETILCEGKPWTGELTKEERERAEEALSQCAEEDAEDAAEAAYEARMEAMYDD